MADTDTIRTVAARFCAQLRADLARMYWNPDAVMDEIRQRNRDETDPGICHSHDFLDANKTMALAMEFTGMDPLDQDPQRCDQARTIWNAAWTMAVAEDLRVVA